MPENLFRRALTCLLTGDVDAKLVLVAALEADWRQGRLVFEGSHALPELINEPGRPDKPLLVSARAVEQRKVSTPEGRAALIHSLAHIEFNAINLALDAVYRFRDLPKDYYDGWIQVAAEEACHFALLRDHLRTLGFDYGDFTAHNGLWDMAMKTAHDPLVRMALVPRGLDVTPAIMHKLASCGDKRAAEILEIILRDEIGHVRIGNRWYAWFCARRGVEPIATFRQLLREYNAPQFRPPFHRNARLAAGFSEAEMVMLEDFSARE